MKRLVLPLLMLLVLGSTGLKAQNEALPDSVRTSPLPENVKSFDGFLLDMSLMPSLLMPSPFLPRYSLLPPDASKDFSYLFRLPGDVSYTTAPTGTFGRGLYGGGLFSSTMFDAADNLQMGSFRLKNGWRINTYGQYNKDGYRVPSFNALPWQRNNFKGAFELKSADGSFGFKVEVHQGR